VGDELQTPRALNESEWYVMNEGTQKKNPDANRKRGSDQNVKNARERDSTSLVPPSEDTQH
jgi:hypothetical protein